MSSRHLLVALTLAAIAPGASGAEPSAADIGDRTADAPALGAEGELFALDHVLKAETTVASRKARSLRETPGIVTLITREEILESGARDLADVLATVPGFQFAGDVFGVVGVGFRGNWGHEGKVLLLVDGQEMNEMFFGTLQFGNHYPLDHVQAIEVVRGPGSAIYGGTAELAVVNVVTRGADHLAGLSAEARYGLWEDGLARRSVSLAYGRRFGDLAVTGQAVFGEGNRSTGVYQGFDGVSYGMAGNSAIDPGQVNVSLAWRGLGVRFFHDEYRTTSRDATGFALGQTEPQLFRSTFVDASYAIAVGDKLRLTPRLTYRRQLAWQDPDTGHASYYDKTGERFRAQLLATADLAAGVSVVAGAEAQLDRAWLNNSTLVPGTSQTLFGTEERVSYSNLAALGEASWDTPVANLLAGARFEHHQAFGSSFVPRLAATKLLDPFHLKLLYSTAFRAPAIENVNLGVDVRPERTRVLETEMGVQLSSLAYLAVNAFDLTIDDAIVYLVTEAGLEGYQNFARTGSRGVEVDCRLRSRRATATLRYSFYTAREKNEVGDYAVPDRPDLLLAFPAHKVTAAATLNVARGVSLTPSAVWYSERFAYTGVDAAGAGVVGRIPPKLYLGLSLAWRDFLVRNLELDVGAHDLLDTGTSYYQPYAGGHAALPGGSREWFLRLGYTHSL